MSIYPSMNKVHVSPYHKGRLFFEGAYSDEKQWVERETYDRVCAQLEVAKAATSAAVSKAEWQARTNQELNEHLARITELEKALREIAALDYKNAATNGAAYEAVQIASRVLMESKS